MTKFYLKNKLSRISLNGDSGYLFVNVTGLGATLNQDFESVTGGAFTITSKSEGQGTINGEIYFTGSDAYTSYNTLVNWLAKYYTFSLIMNVNGTEYARDVVLRSITKTEFNGNSRKAEVSFYAVTAWYTTTTYSDNMFLNNQLGADFDFKLTCVAATHITVSNLDVPILGMSFDSYSGTVNVSGSIGNFSITNASGDSLMDYVDLSETTIPKLFTGTLLISVEASSGTATISDITVRNYFRTV